MRVAGGHSGKLTTAPSPRRLADRPKFRFEGLVVAAFTTIVACYAAAVIVRIVMAYGT